MSVEMISLLVFIMVGGADGIPPDRCIFTGKVRGGMPLDKGIYLFQEAVENQNVNPFDLGQALIIG